MPTDTITPLLLSREDTAKLLSCCTRTIDQLERIGELASVRIGRRVLFDRRDIEHFIHQKKARVCGAGVNQGTEDGCTLQQTAARG